MENFFEKTLHPKNALSRPFSFPPDRVKHRSFHALSNERHRKQTNPWKKTEASGSDNGPWPSRRWIVGVVLSIAVLLLCAFPFFGNCQRLSRHQMGGMDS